MEELKTKSSVNSSQDLVNRREFVDFNMVTFSLGGRDYGIDIMYVKEISRVNEFTYIPNSASFVRGVYNLRGEIISVMDLRKLFNLIPKVSKDKLEDLLVLHSGEHMTGVVVDTIDRVVGVSSSRIQPPHPLFADINISFIHGIVEVEGRLYIILDVEKILSTGKRDLDEGDDSFRDKALPGFVSGMGVARKGNIDKANANVPTLGSLATTVSVPASAVAEKPSLPQPKKEESAVASQKPKLTSPLDSNKRNEWVAGQQSKTDDIVSSMRKEVASPAKGGVASPKQAVSETSAAATFTASEDKKKSPSASVASVLKSAASVASENSGAGAKTSASKESSGSITLSEFVQQLEKHTGFIYSPVNQKAVRDFFASNKKSYKTADDYKGFLTQFLSRSSHQFWSEEMIREMVQFLPDSKEGAVYAWNPGCSEGQESYSLAVSMMEKYQHLQFRIWANDTDLVAVSSAPVLDLTDLPVSPQFERYLEEAPFGKRFTKRVSDSVLFEYHDLVHDNSYPAMDIIVARDFFSFVPSKHLDRTIKDFLNKLKPGCHIVIGDNEELSYPKMEKVPSTLFNVYVKKK